MSDQKLESGFYIEQMSEKDLAKVMLWAKHEHWNMGLHDAKLYYDIDPEGFFVGKIGDQIVSSISGLRYEKDYAFVGCIWLMNHIEKRDMARLYGI